MAKPISTEPALPVILIAMTAVTGIIDAVSFVALGHVFTANMTGNVVLLGFATAGLAGASISRSSTALSAFLVGATFGGRLVAKAEPEALVRVALRGFGIEVALLIGAALAAIGFDAAAPSRAALYSIIACTGLAMGIRNAIVRKLAYPDLTTTVLTMTLTGLAADSSLAHGTNPRWQRRIAVVVAMFAGAAAGVTLVAHSVLVALIVCAAVSALCSTALLLALRRRV